MIAALFVQVAPTATDRISLYFLPIQIAVFAKLPTLVQNRGFSQLCTVGIVFGYALVLFVWLNFALNANDWIPYGNLIFLSRLVPVEG